MCNELLANVMASNVPSSYVLRVTCADCGTVNRVNAWCVYPLPGTDDGATAVTCYACDARQYDIPASAIPAEQLDKVAYAYTPPAPTPVVAFNSSLRLHESR